MNNRYKVSGVIYSAFNDIIKLIRVEYGWNLNNIKVHIKPMKNKQIDLTDNVLSVNPYFTRYLKSNNLEFDNIKTFFVLMIAQELGKELYTHVWSKDMIDSWNTITDRFEQINPGEYDDDKDKLSTYFANLVYFKMKERLDSYGKEEQDSPVE